MAALEKGGNGGAIVINEPTDNDNEAPKEDLTAAEKADADYARQLQAKLAVQDARAANR